jgi:hypothetical protein
MRYLQLALGQQAGKVGMPRRSILNGHDGLSSLLGGVQIKGREMFRKMTEEAILASSWTRKQFWRVGDELAGQAQ